MYFVQIILLLLYCSVILTIFGNDKLHYKRFLNISFKENNFAPKGNHSLAVSPVTTPGQTIVSLSLCMN